MSNNEEKATPEVIINGVQYVPATSIPGAKAVLDALALQYHTPETLEEYGYSGLSITVSEDEGEETFDEFAARLAKLTE